MSSRRWLLAGVALILGSASGCRLFCDRYCEHEYDHCGRMVQNRGCAPTCAPACPPGCAPAVGYYTPQPAPQGTYCP